MKPNTMGNMLQDSIFMKCPEELSLQRRKVRRLMASGEWVMSDSEVNLMNVSHIS